MRFYLSLAGGEVVAEQHDAHLVGGDVVHRSPIDNYTGKVSFKDSLGNLILAENGRSFFLRIVLRNACSS